MAYPYITKEQLEARLSADVVRQIYDDNSDGVADDDPIDQLLADASSKVASYLRPIYDLDLVAASPPHEVVRLTLDVAQAMACLRFPSYTKGDGEAVMEAAMADLKSLRKGDTRLDVKGPPEPAANNGGLVNNTRTGNGQTACVREKFALDGTGDF